MTDLIVMIGKLFHTFHSITPHHVSAVGISWIDFMSSYSTTNYLIFCMITNRLATCLAYHMGPYHITSHHKLLIAQVQKTRTLACILTSWTKAILRTSGACLQLVYDWFKYHHSILDSHNSTLFQVVVPELIRATCLIVTFLFCFDGLRRELQSKWLVVSDLICR